jgi:hypothetical protein
MVDTQKFAGGGGSGKTIKEELEVGPFLSISGAEIKQDFDSALLLLCISDSPHDVSVQSNPEFSFVLKGELVN